MNLVILDFGYADDGIVEMIDIICPTNVYATKLFDETKPTFFVVKYENDYQPVQSIILRIKQSISNQQLMLKK